MAGFRGGLWRRPPTRLSASYTDEIPTNFHENLDRPACTAFVVAVSIKDGEEKEEKEVDVPACETLSANSQIFRSGTPDCLEWMNSADTETREGGGEVANTGKKSRKHDMDGEIAAVNSGKDVEKNMQDSGQCRRTKLSTLFLLFALTIASGGALSLFLTVFIVVRGYQYGVGALVPVILCCVPATGICAWSFLKFIKGCGTYGG